MLNMKALAVILAAIAICACGSTGRAGPGLSSPSPLPSGLTNGDQGNTYAARVGDVIEITLRQESGYTPWAPITTSDASVVQRQPDTRSSAVIGVTLARFKAIAPGTAILTSSSGVLCSPGAACPALARDWHVTVRVS